MNNKTNKQGLKLSINKKTLIKFKTLLKVKFLTNKLTLTGKNYNKFYSEYKNQSIDFYACPIQSINKQ